MGGKGNIALAVSRCRYMIGPAGTAAGDQSNLPREGLGV